MQLRGLCKSFGRHPVLRSIDLDLEPGRITAIVGPNGSGKSTLIRIVLGLVRPDAGRVLLHGTVLDGDPSWRRSVGYMPQLPRFPDHLTGREVLALLADLRRAEGPPDDALIDAFDLRPDLDKRLATLSTGTRQKLNAVIAFRFRPPVLILDEPTAGLDPVAAAVLKDRLRREREGGRAIALTTHVMAEVEEMADTVAFLLDGSLRFVSAPADVRRDTGEDTLERGIARIMRERRTA